MEAYDNKYLCCYTHNLNFLNVLYKFDYETIWIIIWILFEFELLTTTVSNYVHKIIIH